MPYQLSPARAAERWTPALRRGGVKSCGDGDSCPASYSETHHTAQQFAIDFNGVSLPTGCSLDIRVEDTEE